MEEIEYLEEYESLILPMSFAGDDDKRNDRKSIDSLEMLYKDLIEETSIHQSNADTSPFSLNQQMVSPEKTILSSTVEIGLAQSLSNYSMNTTSPTYVNTTNTSTLNSYQAQPSNIQFLNRLTNKTFSTYSSLQKPDKLKSVATVKPTLQRVNNPPKQYVQRESPILKASISGQSTAQSQHNFNKPSSTKTTFELKNSSNNSKNNSKLQSSLKVNKLSTSGIDPLAGLDDDTFLDFDEKNGLVDGFDFESDLDNSIIAGLSDMDSDSVDFSDGFIDDNFDLESDLSSEGSDLKKLLKRKRPQMNSKDSSERQNTISSVDLKRDVSNCVKKKQSPNKYGSDHQLNNQKTITAELKRTQPMFDKELLPKASSNVGKEALISAKVGEAINKGNNIFNQLLCKLNESPQQTSNVQQLTPTVPLCHKTAEKPENGFKQFLGINMPSHERSCLPKKDDRIHSIVDPFKGFDESLTSKLSDDDAFKNNLVEQNSLKTPQNSTLKASRKDVSLEKSPIKFGSFYLRSIKPPAKKNFPIKSATNSGQQPVLSKVLQTVKKPEDTPQESAVLSTAKNSNTSMKVVADISKTLNPAAVPTLDVSTNCEKRKSVPKFLEAKNHVSNEIMKDSSQSKPQKGQGISTAPNKEVTIGKTHESIGKLKPQKSVNDIRESMFDKESTIPRTEEAKRKDSIDNSKVQTQITAAMLEKNSAISKPEEAKEASCKPKIQSQSKQKNISEKKASLKMNKGNITTKTQEAKDRDINEKLKAQIQPKPRKSVGERTTTTIQKLSTLNAQEAKEEETDNLKKQSQVKRRRSAVEKNRKKSTDRVSEKKLQTLANKEKDEKQIKTASKCVEEERQETACNGNVSAQNIHQQTNKVLLNSTPLTPQSDKKLPLQQYDETQSQQSIPEIVQENLLPSKRRKSVMSRKLLEANTKLKATKRSKKIPDQPLEHTTTVITEEQPLSIDHQKLVPSQSLQKGTIQVDNEHQNPISQPNTKASARVRSAKTSLKKLKPRSPKKVGSLEQKKLVARGFKIRLNRKTVDHFMKSLKEHTDTTSHVENKDLELKIIKSPLRRMPKLKRFDSPLTIRRPRKTFQKKVPNPPPSLELKKVPDEVIPPGDTPLATSLVQNEPQVKENVTVEVNACPILKKRKRKNLESNQPAKIPRRDITSAIETISLPNKDSINDQVPPKEQCLADGTNIAPATTMIPTEASSADVRTEATTSEVPEETSSLVDPKNIVSPVTSTSAQQSPTVPTTANSPTFPTDAASPAVPSFPTSLASATAISSEPVQLNVTESPLSVNSVGKKRGRPISKKTLRRAALARRRELIKASTSQRLTETNVDQTNEEPAPDPIPLPTPVELENECITNENIEIASSSNSQPPDGPCLTIENLVQPKTEIGDSVNSEYQVPGSATAMFDGAPTVYSFTRPIDTHRRNSELFLDACQNLAHSLNMEQNSTAQSVAVFDLPAYIVMKTRIITRNDIQSNKTVIPPQVKETVNKLAENVNVTTVVKTEEPDFKDICLEINTLLGRNANYLKFASSSERQARMNQILSDSSLSVQEAQSALKFLQSYLSARTKEPAVVSSNTKGQQFIPIYDSQKKVIGYRQRRVHPKKAHLQTERTTQSSRLRNRNSNVSSATTASLNCSTSTANEVLSVEVAQYSTKKEPQSTDAGEEELIVPDAPPTDKPIKRETES